MVWPQDAASQWCTVWAGIEQFLSWSSIHGAIRCVASLAGSCYVDSWSWLHRAALLWVCWHLAATRCLGIRPLDKVWWWDAGCRCATDPFAVQAWPAWWRGRGCCFLGWGCCSCTALFRSAMFSEMADRDQEGDRFETGGTVVRYCIEHSLEWKICRDCDMVCVSLFYWGLQANIFLCSEFPYMEHSLQWGKAKSEKK